MEKALIREVFTTMLVFCAVMIPIGLIIVAVYGKWQDWTIVFAPVIAMFGVIATMLLVITADALITRILDLRRRK